MSYCFDMYGEFKFDKQLPSEIIKIFKDINEDCERGSEWFRDAFKNQNIVAEWCPWVYDEKKNTLHELPDASYLNNNYWFVDWLGWIIESICIPYSIKLNGEGYWHDDGNAELRDEHFPCENFLPEGDGKFFVEDNFIKVKGIFFGNDDWKKTVRRVNNIVKPKEVIEKKPTEDIKGSFCVTGKVSMSRNEFQKLGVAHGYEFKSSVTKDLTFLVCNDPNSTSSKIKNAKKNGIKVITEDEFRVIIGCA